ncbi:MAG: hypothetical protein Ta2E_11970 [Mycoplasmoidaceae bacterium]|nr:MAG: hypothetical protein Ta2E_11970 [Mycoplasmoidaceae bacterium]
MTAASEFDLINKMIIMVINHFLKKKSWLIISEFHFLSTLARNVWYPFNMCYWYEL